MPLVRKFDKKMEIIDRRLTYHGVNGQKMTFELDDLDNLISDESIPSEERLKLRKAIDALELEKFIHQLIVVIEMRKA